MQNGLFTVSYTHLDVYKRQVYRFIKSGTLPSLRLGRIKIRGIDLERFINSFPVELPDTTDNEEREAG